MLRGPADDPGRRGRPIRTGRRDKPIIQLPSVALRVAVVAGIGAVLFGIILFRLWFLQILSGQEFVAQANDNRLRSVKIVAPRGSIVDRNGTVLVDNTPGLAVGVRLMDVPKGQLDALIDHLSHVLKTPPAKLQKTILQHVRPSWPLEIPLTWQNVVAGKSVGLDLVVVKQKVSKKDVSYILEHQQSFPGVEIQKDFLRAYPQGNLLAQTVGHVGEVSAEQLKTQHFKGYSAGDVVGYDGLEYTYDPWLRGRDGVAKIEVDAFGRPKQSDPVPGGRLAEPGDTLVTTIDAKVQAAAEQALAAGIDLAHKSGNPEANGGAAVVLDAKTGAVIAMASNPTYDPSVWSGGISEKQYKLLAKKSANYPLLNRVTQESKAVGSTFKPIDAIAGLEEGVITPGTTFWCDGSYVAPGTLDKHVFKCWATSGHGTLDLNGAITQSCDVYFYNVGDLFYQRKGTELEDWAMHLGMGRATGIDIPGEVSGRVPTPTWKKQYFKTEIDKIWKPGDSILLAVGQGNLEATPLQLATTYAAIANGGTIVTPHLGLRITDATGATVRNLEPAPTHKVDIAQSTLDAVRRGLFNAANDPAGTSAPVFAGYSVSVSGKTGTAEVWDNGRFVNYAWYASYAPTNDPKYVTVVMIEKGGHGGDVAAPAARLIYDSLFHLKSSGTFGPVRSD